MNLRPTYNCWVYFKDKTLDAIKPEWLGFTAQKITKTGVGYRITLGDSVGVVPSIPEEHKSMNRVYVGFSLKGVLQALSSTHKIPIVFANIEHAALFRKDRDIIHYKLNGSFEQNIQYIADQVGFEILIEEEELPYTVVIYEEL